MRLNKTLSALMVESMWLPMFHKYEARVNGATVRHAYQSSGLWFKTEDA